MHRRYTLISRAPHRLDTVRSDTQSTFESSRTTIATLIGTSHPYEPLLRRPCASFERSARNLSNENVLNSKIVAAPETNLLSSAGTVSRGPPQSRRFPCAVLA
jgi:hypothetical protein